MRTDASYLPSKAFRKYDAICDEFRDCGYKEEQNHDGTDGKRTGCLEECDLDERGEAV
jgi:hypothetical protein